jgi:hypothetical protein
VHSNSRIAMIAINSISSANQRRASFFTKARSGKSLRDTSTSSDVPGSGKQLAALVSRHPAQSSFSAQAGEFPECAF